MNRTHLSLFFAPLLLTFAASACFSDLRDHLSAGGSAGTDDIDSDVRPDIDPGIPELPSAAPPGPGPIHLPDGAASTTFTLRKLFLGDTGRDDTPDKVNGWKQYGFDIDGIASTPESPGHCKPRSGAVPKVIQADGHGGIDNSFGRNVLPLFLAMQADFSGGVNKAITEGEPTALIEIQKLGAGGDYNPVFAQIFGGLRPEKAPLFDGSDVWPVSSSSVLEASPALTSTLQIPDSYVTGGTWVGRVNGNTLPLTLNVGSFSLQLMIANPILMMDLDSTHTSATGGTIAGVLAIQPLLAEFKKILGGFDSSLCDNNSTIQAILAQVEQAADILVDGTQSPMQLCNAVSIGIGFEASAVTLGPVGQPPPSMADPCSGN